jgi:hypothetical protein
MQELAHGVPHEGQVRQDEVVDCGRGAGHLMSLGSPGRPLEEMISTSFRAVACLFESFSEALPRNHAGNAAG